MSVETLPTTHYIPEYDPDSLVPIESLVLAAQAGDMDAMGDIYARTYPSLYGDLYRRTADPYKAADLAQATFEKALKHISAYQEQGSFTGWIHTIGRHLLLDSVRYDKKRVIGIPHFTEDNLVANDDVEAEALQNIDTSTEDVLQHVSDVYRDAVRLITIQGLSYQEAADQLGIPLGTVRSRNHRGIKELKKKFKNREEVLFPVTHSA